MVTETDPAASPNTPSSQSLRPQLAGELTPAGGATCRPRVLNRWPMKPSGVQLAMPMRPPGRHTRIISAAVFAWFGANIAPKVETTASKALSR
jgi:hypothetical protein